MGHNLVVFTTSEPAPVCSRLCTLSHGASAHAWALYLREAWRLGPWLHSPGEALVRNATLAYLPGGSRVWASQLNEWADCEVLWRAQGYLLDQ